MIELGSAVRYRRLAIQPLTSDCRQAVAIHALFVGHEEEPRYCRRQDKTEDQDDYTIRRCTREVIGFQEFVNVIFYMTHDHACKLIEDV